MKALALKLLDLLRYPSTYHGLNGLLVAVGVTLRPDLLESGIAAAAALSGLIALLFSDADVKAKK
jgi:hypothetical protein